MMDGPPGHSGALPLWRRLRTAPRLSDAPRAESHLAEFLSTPARAGLQSLAEEPYVRALLLALADHSPFLWRLVTANASRLLRCLETAPEAQP